MIPRRLYDATNRAAPNDAAHSTYVSVSCEPWETPVIERLQAPPTCEVCGVVLSTGTQIPRCGKHRRSLPHQKQSKLARKQP